MPLIHMMVGIQCSGKSTFARNLSKELNIPIVSSDETRNKYPDVEEKNIWPLIYGECYACLEKGQDFIYDATNVSPYIRNLFRERIKERFQDFEIGTYYFVADPQVCYERCLKRNQDPSERYLPPEVIFEYAKKIVPPGEDEGFVFRKEFK